MAGREEAGARRRGPLAALALALLAATFLRTPLDGLWSLAYLALEPRLVRGLAAVVALALVAAASEREALAPLRRAAERLFELLSRLPRPGTARLLVLAMAAGAAAIAAWLSTVLFERIPHVEDSVCQLLHAKVLAAGRVAAPSPPLPEFFAVGHMIVDDGWYSQYPPGHVALLALGVLAGAPWLVNPILAAAAVLATAALGRELGGPRTALLAAALAAASPFLLLMSAEMMNHASAHVALLVFAWAVLRAERTGRWRDALAAGVALGAAFLVRPYTAAAFGAPLAFLLLLRARDPSRRSPLAVFALAFAAVASLHLAWNQATNGSPLLFGYVKRYGPGLLPGFGGSGWGPRHTPELGLASTLRNLNALEGSLFEWPIPSLLFAFALLASGRARRREAALGGSAASLVVAHFFYWYQDLCFGPRFYFESTGAVAVLTALGLRALPETYRTGTSSGARRVVQLAAVGLVAASFVHAAVVRFPALMGEYGPSYRGVDRSVRDAAQASGIEEAVVFVGNRYLSVYAENDPWLRGPLVWAKDLGARNRELLARLPGRRGFRYDEASRRFEPVEGGAPAP